MVQDFVVLLIVASAVSYVIFTFIRSIKVKNEQSACGGCSGCELSKNKAACKL